MPAVRDCDLYMVGSMAAPSDTVEESMGMAAEALGDRLCALPDGEVGLRSVWTAGLGQLVYSRHPDIKEVQGGFPGPFGPLGAYRLDGELDLTGYLPYGDAAIASYPTYKALKDRGRIAPDVRFQVALPTPHAAIVAFFGDPAQWPAARAAYHRALVADIARILEVVPAGELLIQWDYCTEVVDIIAAATGHPGMRAFLTWVPEESAEDLFAAHTGADYIATLSEGIPDAVQFGYHVCLGTFPEFPTVPAPDLAWVVRIANAIVANTPRRVDFVMLPAMADAGREFFAPLADLDVGDARVFLGIGQRDGSDAIVARGETAREFLPDFGISHYCGYGRDDRERFGQLLADLRAAADGLLR